MKFHTQLKAKDIFKFSLAYTYSGLQGLFTLVLLVAGVYMIINGMGQAQGQSQVIFGIVIIGLFIVVNPLMLYVKAKKQSIENPVYKVPTYYTLKEEGIFVELGDDSAMIEWERVLKISHIMGLNILYTGRKQAFVFPDYELGENKDKMLSYMKEHMKSAVRNPQPAGGADISKYSKAAVKTKDDMETEQNELTKEDQETEE